MALSRRAAILTMLGAISAISYLERVCISVLSPPIMDELGLSQPQMGTVFSAFMLGYA
jgi:MFS transporter, ACS family, glucarate transporter